MPTNVRTEVRDNLYRGLNMLSKDADISHADALNSTQCIAPKAGLFGNASGPAKGLAICGLISLGFTALGVARCSVVIISEAVKAEVNRRRA